MSARTECLLHDFVGWDDEPCPHCVELDQLRAKLQTAQGIIRRLVETRRGPNEAVYFDDILALIAEGRAFLEGETVKLLDLQEQITRRWLIPM